MRVSLRNTIVLALGVGLECIIVLFILFHIGGGIWRFSQLTAALIGGVLTLVSVHTTTRSDSPTEPWVGYEQLSWTLIGCGLILWGVGESFFRYYLWLNQSSFPSLADIGYSCFPLLCFAGLVLLPSANTERTRLFVVLDSLISMGAILAIGWYLLLGSLAQSSATTGLAKFLGLYYPTTDTALLSCVVLLMLRGQSKLYQVPARRISLLIVGLGLCFFATSDFLFNLQQNANTYVDGTWVDLGWPLGMITIGLAAYLRRFLPKTVQDSKESSIVQHEPAQGGFGFVQLIPYILIAILFLVLTLNVISADPGQVAIRLVLLLATIGVIGLVIVRQILTMLENERLSLLQAHALEQIEEQARQITERNIELEEGISHLKAVQTSLANGNLRARAYLTRGALWSLASSLNLLADRLMTLGQARRNSERLAVAIIDLSSAIERYRMGQAFIFPLSCHGISELTPLIHAMGLQKIAQQQEAPAHSTVPYGSTTVQANPVHNAGKPNQNGFSTPASTRSGSPLDVRYPSQRGVRQNSPPFKSRQTDL